MYILRSVGALSLGKIMGAIYGSLGIISLPVFVIMAIATTMSGRTNGALGIAGAITLAVLFPLLYGVIGFVAGAITALLYNLFAKWMGGIELALKAVPPLPPPAL
ncbi:MAG: hypothetical protein H0X25_18285 [Acidobacteriales bacterium]|nr:hypothetical protein [Terriglobales bacterium]